MGRETVLFSSEERTDAGRVSAFLRELAGAVDAGQVTLRSGRNELTVSVPRTVVLEIKVEEEAKGNKTKQSLEVEIEWYEGEDAGGSVSVG